MILAGDAARAGHACSCGRCEALGAGPFLIVATGQGTGDLPVRRRGRLGRARGPRGRHHRRVPPDRAADGRSSGRHRRGGRALRPRPRRAGALPAVRDLARAVRPTRLRPAAARVGGPRGQDHVRRASSTGPACDDRPTRSSRSTATRCSPRPPGSTPGRGPCGPATRRTASTAAASSCAGSGPTPTTPRSTRRWTASPASATTCGWRRSSRASPARSTGSSARTASAVLRPIEMVNLRRPGAEPAALRRGGELLRPARRRPRGDARRRPRRWGGCWPTSTTSPARSRSTGSSGADGWLPTELNPRYGGGLQLPAGAVPRSPVHGRAPDARARATRPTSGPPTSRRSSSRPPTRPAGAAAGR